MASAPPADSPARVAFQLERLEAGADGLLEVEGTWSGVRGMRFVRPALVIRDGAHQRTLLATLEHKPWAPDSRPWRASFPWDGGELDPERAELAVAPSVIVPLAGAAAPVRADPQETLRRALDEARERVRHLESEVAFLRREREGMVASDAARRDRAALEDERDAACRERDAADARRQEAIAERDAALAERDRAVARRDRERRERDRAHRELEAAREALAGAEAARDQALAQPAGVVPLDAIVRRRRAAENHERDATRADWAARVAALLAVLVLLVLLITFLKAF
jgi:hypothetical protein